MDRCRRRLLLGPVLAAVALAAGCSRTAVATSGGAADGGPGDGTASPLELRFAPVAWRPDRTGVVGHGLLFFDVNALTDEDYLRLHGGYEAFLTVTADAGGGRTG